MRHRGNLVIAVAALVAGSGSAATAYETGIAAIHAWHTVGNKTCIKDHWHDGSASQQPSKKAAEAVAIKVWIDFTALDYGSDWMHYRIAESKLSRCEQKADGWSCIVSARACKPNRVPKRTAAKQ